jgi:hypothetical protein
MPPVTRTPPWAVKLPPRPTTSTPNASHAGSEGDVHRAAQMAVDRSNHSSGGGGADTADMESSPKTPPRIRHPNFNIVFFSLGFTLPFTTAQVICALFTKVCG